MSPLDDIFSAVLKSPPDLETALLNCVRLGRTAQVPELETWARYEHDGYPDDATLPEYRVVRSSLLGTFVVGSAFQGWHRITGRPIDNIQDFTPDIRRNMETHYLRDSVGTMRLLSDDGSMAKVLDSRVAQIVTSRQEGGAACDQVYVPVPPGTYAAIRDNVRSKIVDFVMELQERFPDFEITPQTATPKVQGAVREIVHRFDIVAHPGSAVNVNAGSGSQIIDQQIASTITINDRESLFAALREQGVDEEDLSELDDYLDDDEAVQAFVEERGPIRRWVNRTAGSVAGGGKKLAFEAVKLILLELVKQYVLVQLGITPGPPMSPPPPSA